MTGFRTEVYGIEPLVVTGPEAARICRVSERTWRSMNAAGRCPRPIHIGRRRLWVVAELRAWVAAGAPARERWEAARAGAGNPVPLREAIAEVMSEFREVR